MPRPKGSKNKAAPVAPVKSTPANRTEQGRFQKGVSGNPNGRPAVAMDIRRFARQHTQEAFQKLIDIMRNEDAPIAEQRASAMAIIERGYGKPIQQVGTGGPGAFSDLADAEIEAFILDQASKFVEERSQLN